MPGQESASLDTACPGAVDLDVEVSTHTATPSAKVRIPFGVHRGKTLDQVPEEYLKWLVDTNDGTRYLWLAKQIREFLATAEDIPDEIDPHDYDAYLTDLRGRGNYFIVPRAFLQVFAFDEALVLCHLLNFAQSKPGDEGWVLCTASFLENSLHLDLDDQRRILRSVEDLGVLEQAKRGNPPRRHVRLDVRRIEELVKEALP